MVVHFYKKHPIVIKALQLEDNWDEVKDFVGGDVFDDPVEKDGEIGLRISTLEGKAGVHSGDWIIQGVEGEFLQWRADIFEETYARTCHLDELISDQTAVVPLNMVMRLGYWMRAALKGPRWLDVHKDCRAMSARDRWDAK